MAFSESVKKKFNLWYLWRKLKTWVGRRRAYKYTIDTALECGSADGGLNVPAFNGELSHYMREVINAAELLISRYVQYWHKADEKLLTAVLKWKRQRVVLRYDRQKLDAQREILKGDSNAVQQAKNQAERDCKASDHSHHSKFLFILTVILVFGLDTALISQAAAQFAGSDVQAILFGMALAGIFGAAAHVVGGLTANAWYPAARKQAQESTSSIQDKFLASITLERVFSFLSWGTALFLSVLGLYAISCVRVEAFSSADTPIAISLWPSSIGMLFFCLQLMFFAVAVFASMRDQIPEVAKCRANKESKNRPAKEIAALNKQIALIDKRLPFLDNKYDEAKERRNKFHARLSEESREATLAASQNLAAYQRANNMSRADGKQLDFDPIFLPFARREGCQLVEPSDEELLQGLVSKLPPPSSPHQSVSSENWPVTEKEGEVM